MNDSRRGFGCFGVVLCFVTILLVSLSVFRATDDWSGYEKTLDFSAWQESDSAPDVSELERKAVYYQLSPEEMAVFDTLLEGVAAGKLSFVFEEIGPEEFDRAYQAFLYDRPEFFWLSNRYQYRHGSSFSVELGVYDYWKYTVSPEKYIRELNEAVEAIVAEGARYETPYEKLLFVHDYLSDHVTYDHEALKEVNNTLRSTSAEHALSVYGALVNGKTLCGGYAEAFYLLTRKLGLESYYMQGYSGEYHAWNYLCIDGEYYYMDVTWDDRDCVDEEGNPISGALYTYFCITSEQLLKDHTPDSDFDAPYGDSVSYDRYRRENYYFETYDREAVCDAIDRQVEKTNGLVSVKFASEEEMNRAVEDLFGQDHLGDCAAFRGSYRVRYQGIGTVLYLYSV